METTVLVDVFDVLTLAPEQGNPQKLKKAIIWMNVYSSYLLPSSCTRVLSASPPLPGGSVCSHGSHGATTTPRRGHWPLAYTQWKFKVLRLNSLHQGRFFWSSFYISIFSLQDLPNGHKVAMPPEWEKRERTMSRGSFKSAESETLAWQNFCDVRRM